jgi:Na+/proline symporter
MTPNDSQPTGHGSRTMWLMMLACLVPLVLLLALGSTAFSSSPALFLPLVVVCPLMMLLLMGGGHGGEHQPPSR